jgi:16S rRNA (cytosine967-C5)-methyltransferase
MTQTKPLSVRALAAQLVDTIIKQQISFEATLNNDKNAAAIAALNSPDQSLLQELCYGCLRWHQQLEYCARSLLKQPLKPQESLVFVLLQLGIYQLMHTRIPTYAAIAATAEVARELKKNWAVGLVNAVLRNFQRRKKILQEQLTKPPQAAESSTALIKAAQYAHPTWLIETIEKAYPQQWREILIANNQRPPMHLRVNLQATSRKQYLQLLAQHNITATAAAHCNSGITLVQPPALAVNELPRFQDGWVSVQDLAAQLAAELLELDQLKQDTTATNQQLRVLDACAAPGGKLTHILEAAPHLDEVVAIEMDQRRIKKIEENLQRYAASCTTGCCAAAQANTSATQASTTTTSPKAPKVPPAPTITTPKLTILAGDATNPAAWWDGKKFDRILLDAPCSATGIIRRHPDIKLLKHAHDIDALAKQQLAMLKALWPLLKDGGVLLYATCSVLPQENWLVIEQFLAQQQNAHEKPIHATSTTSTSSTTTPSATTTSPPSTSNAWGIAVPHGRQILPGSNNMDGFYYAKLIKTTNNN